MLKVIFRWIMGDFTLYFTFPVLSEYFMLTIFDIYNNFKNTNYNLEKQNIHFPELKSISEKDVHQS